MKYLLLISLFALGGCDEKKENPPAEKIQMTLGGDFHYGVPHNTGHAKENPSNGCPCVTLALGWSTYDIKTNAVAHGYGSLYDLFRSRRNPNGNKPIRIADIYELEKQLVEEWKAEGVAE